MTRGGKNESFIRIVIKPTWFYAVQYEQEYGYGIMNIIRGLVVSYI